MHNERHARPLITRLRDRFAPAVRIRFDADAEAIIVTPGGLRLRVVPVAAVARVEAGNRDTVQDETVCLFFHLDGEAPLVVTETERGFGKLVSDLAGYFPGIDAWESAIPPVAHQLTSVDLWRREAYTVGPMAAGEGSP